MQDVAVLEIILPFGRYLIMLLYVGGLLDKMLDNGFEGSALSVRVCVCNDIKVVK